MSLETERYDNEQPYSDPFAKPQLSAKPQVITITAADLAKNAGETMDGEAPAPKQAKVGKGKPAATGSKAKATEPLKEYVVLDTQTGGYTRVEPDKLQAMAREIEGQPHKFLVRILPLRISINVEITE